MVTLPGDPDAAVQLVARGGVPPCLNVHRRGNGGAVVGHVGLQCTVEEQKVLRILENARPVVMGHFRQLVNVDAAFKVELVP